MSPEEGLGFLGTSQMLPIYQLLFVGNFLIYVILAPLARWCSTHWAEDRRTASDPRPR